MRRLLRLILVVLLVAPSGCAARDWLNVFTKSTVNSDQYHMSKLNRGNSAAVPPDGGP